ncbi:L-lactate dehydrogenase [Sandarakinorhabdus sp. AAP62]|uniref:L-lactate dehydrogenase n=1 Tax=Sandarakinorhabdus sp. AAP62 TaxID=1248916 RepID=UPI0002D7807D|nr:L-lactate dehydrogenase [Sandarakinorhabdus sp. AAP62]
MKLASIADYRAASRRRVPRFLFDYTDGGSYAEQTLAANVGDLAAVQLDQRVLVDVSRVETRVKLLGQTLAMPVILAPVGLAGLHARRGEVQAWRAAREAGVAMALSTVSICSLAEVTTGGGAAPWFQLYLTRDKGANAAMIAEAKAQGCPALMLTVDLPTPGARYRDVRSSLTGAPGLAGTLHRAAQVAARPRWAVDVGLFGGPVAMGNLTRLVGATAPLSDYLGWLARNFDASADWDRFAWVRSLWPGPLIVKGILHPDDAALAVQHGADAIVVSNHGGRQLDGAISAVRALPAIMDRLGGCIPVLADGGVRSGLDVLRYHMLGAAAVMIGRPWVWGLGAGGQAGVAHVLQLIRAELETAMALTGRTRLA